MDKMFFGLGSNIQGIPLAPTIIAAMRDMVNTYHAEKTLGFPILISRFLQKAHAINANDTKLCTNEKKHVLRKETLTSLKFIRRDVVWINPFRVDEQELDDSDEEWVESEEEEEENQVIAPAAANAEELSDRELLMNLIASVNALGVKVDHMQGTLDQLVANQQQQPPSP
ncbi:hypothetical protein CCACVL1_11949 [Corchorus capsularis]|uniref:Uncharacterized protein n=1 Tax=Corchorus capsularis TaxID=210143 RepID=A0A1R3IIN9_COCAP|nr:hypothetical protein CCACVL1_11949 [Corchorus capsularis]